MVNRRIKRRININPVLIKVFLSILVIASFLLVVWQRTQVLRLGYQLERMEATKKELLKENKMLLLEVSNLSSLQRIEKIASEDLGLKAPDRKKIYIVKRVREKDLKPLLAKGP